MKDVFEYIDKPKWRLRFEDIDSTGRIYKHYVDTSGVDYIIIDSCSIQTEYYFINL